MKDQTMLTKIKEILYPEAEKSRGIESGGKRPHQQEPFLTKSSEDFESRLKEILVQNTTVSTGRVQLIDISLIIKKMGTTYSKERKDHIYHIVKNSIELRLAAHDTYTKYNDTGYVIVFAELGEKEAQMKSLLIAEEISTRLLGDLEKGNIVEVKTAVVKQDGVVMFEEVPSIQSLARKFDGSSKVVNNDSDTPVQNEDDRGNLDRLQFIFRPMWFVKNRVISTFLCIPVAPIAENKYMTGYNNLANSSDPGSIFDLDLLTLNRVYEELKSMKAEKNMALMTLPVHFETLANKNRRLKYAGLCQQRIFQFKDKVIFEILGLPEGIPDTRLSEFFGSLKPYARSVIARFGLSHTNFLGFRSSGIYAVGVDVFNCELAEKVIMEQMIQFVEAANKAGLKTYAHGIKNISLNTFAISTGFDYVDGYAVTSVANTVNGAYKLQMEDIYSNLT